MIRYELCEDAMRLTKMLAASPVIQNKSNVFAVLSLMLLNASRFRSRLDGEGNILTLENQDRSLWDKELMNQGFYYLEQSTSDRTVSIYHLLATISAWHCAAPDYGSTNWQGILDMYDHLLLLDRSPLVQLNRSIAVCKVYGPERALMEVEAIKRNGSFEPNHLFYSTEAEFYLEMADFQKAVACLQKAIVLSPLEAERALLKKKLERCLQNKF